MPAKILENKLLKESQNDSLGNPQKELLEQYQKDFFEKFQKIIVEKFPMEILQKLRNSCRNFVIGIPHQILSSEFQVNVLLKTRNYLISELQFPEKL